MKIISNLIKVALAGLLIIAFLGISVFTVAGFMPEKNLQTPAGYKKEQSTYVTMKDGTKISVRITLPGDLQKNEKVPGRFLRPLLSNKQFIYS